MTVIVSTMQAFRVEDTEGRKVYEPSGALLGHFDALPAEAQDHLEKFSNGKPKTSLANVISLHRPIVIVDEAHNARTSLSFSTLQRFHPACILEFTATPDKRDSPSNVIHTVSAAELKAEGMIKLPIRLETNQDWKALLSHAIATRNQLEISARNERIETGEYIRPIMLLQAQPHYKNKASLTVDTIKMSLLQDQLIPAEQIAIATGDRNELEGIDLNDPLCPIRYIITVQALREGWDCPFAYILCTVAELHSETAVEQILGRILRLPKAQAKRQADLNRSYAFSASRNFSEAASALSEALIQNGFERQEVKDLVQAPPSPLNIDFGPIFQQVAPVQSVSIPVQESPNLDTLSVEVASKVIYNPENHTLTIHEKLDQEQAEELKKCFILPGVKQAIDNACVSTQSVPAVQVPGKPEPRKSLSIPVLAIQQEDYFEQFEESTFLDHPWKLANRNPLMSEEEFPTNPLDGEQGEIDIDSSGKLKLKFLHELQLQIASLGNGKDWTAGTLARWLDRRISHPDIPPNQSIVFLTNLVESLLRDRGISLGQLVKDKYRLEKAASVTIQKYRLEARNEVYQKCLLPDALHPVVVTPEVCFTYDPDPMNYPAPPNSLYPGMHQFQKHFYPIIGDLKPKGEEYECARFLDSRPEMGVWIRNLEGRPQHSFWLQTSTDKFYPDFVCQLSNGRFLVVEYKGEDRWSDDDSREKRAIGELWAERSGGSCQFIMPKGRDFEAIRARMG
jgi:type III restriction enzyme